MKTIYVLMCAGKGKRWQAKYPKQMADILGESNARRTVRLLLDLGARIEDIRITASNRTEFAFERIARIEMGTDEREIDRFRNAYSLMDLTDRIIFLYGDVVYDEEDLKMIYNSKGDNWFGRTKPNKLTDKINSEIVAISVIDKERFKNAVNTVASKFSRGALQREIGWEVFNQLGEKMVEVSDYTDDYDTGEEYIRIKELYEKKFKQ